MSCACLEGCGWALAATSLAVAVAVVGRATAEGTPVCLEVAACSGRGLGHTGSVDVAGVEGATGGERA